MPLLRRSIRLVLLLVVTSGAFVVLWCALILLRPFPRWRRAGRNGVYRGWSRLCLRIMGGRLRVLGPPPKAPFFLVSNHLSYVDILVLAACTDAYFIAKLEIRGWPLFGILARSVGTIFVDRDSRRDVVRVNRVVEEVLGDGYGVVLFPEGTSTQGYEVARFHSSLLAFPVRQSFPVHVAAITYRTPPGEMPANLSICWWGDAPFFPHASQFMGVRRFEVDVRFSPEVHGGADRKALANELNARVAALFEPVVALDERATDTGF